ANSARHGTDDTVIQCQQINQQAGVTIIPGMQYIGRLQINRDTHDLCQTLECALVICPSGLDLDPEVQHDLAVKGSFHIQSGRLAYAFQTLAILADDNLFLSRFVDQNKPVNMQNAADLFEFFDFYSRFVRQFITKLAGDLFTNQLGDKEP